MKIGIFKTAAAMLLFLAAAAPAAETEKSFTLRAASADIFETTGTQYGIGYGITSFARNGFVWGIDFDLDYLDLDGADVWGYGTALRLGYALLQNDLQFYVLGGALVQSMPGGSGYGFGFGGGADYRLFTHLRVGAEYRTFTITREVGDYDYTQASGFVKFVW